MKGAVVAILTVAIILLILIILWRGEQKRQKIHLPPVPACAKQLGQSVDDVAYQQSIIADDTQLDDILGHVNVPHFPDPTFILPDLNAPILGAASDGANRNGLGTCSGPVNISRRSRRIYNPPPIGTLPCYANDLNRAPVGAFAGVQPFPPGMSIMSSQLPRERFIAEAGQTGGYEPFNIESCCDLFGNKIENSYAKREGLLGGTAKATIDWNNGNFTNIGIKKGLHSQPGSLVKLASGEKENYCGTSPHYRFPVALTPNDPSTDAGYSSGSSGYGWGPEVIEYSRSV